MQFFIIIALTVCHAAFRLDSWSETDSDRSDDYLALEHTPTRPRTPSDRCLGEGSFGSVFEDEDGFARKVIESKIAYRQEVLMNRLLNEVMHEKDRLVLAESINDAEQSIRYPLCETCVDLSSVETFHRLLDSIWYMNNQRIIHFDIKPDNMLTKSGEVCLCDFGCASKISNEFFGYLNPTEFEYTQRYAPWGFFFLHKLAHDNPQILTDRDYQNLLQQEMQAFDFWSLAMSFASKNSYDEDAFWDEYLHLQYWIFSRVSPNGTRIDFNALKDILKGGDLQAEIDKILNKYVNEELKKSEVFWDMLSVDPVKRLKYMDLPLW